LAGGGLDEQAGGVYEEESLVTDGSKGSLRVQMRDVMSQEAASAAFVASDMTPKTSKNLVMTTSIDSKHKLAKATSRQTIFSD
jgi:hypothetical protein